MGYHGGVMYIDLSNPDDVAWWLEIERKHRDIVSAGKSGNLGPWYRPWMSRKEFREGFNSHFGSDIKPETGWGRAIKEMHAIAIIHD